MELRLVEHLSTAAHLVAPVLVERLEAYGAGTGEPLALEALDVRVPIVVETRERLGTPADGATVRICAERNAALFPVFEGSIRVEPAGALSSELVLEGTYTVPLGLAGVVADRTLLADLAAESLRRFLTRLKDEVGAAVLRRETGSR